MPSPTDEKLAMTLAKALNKRFSPETLCGSGIKNPSGP